ncbi:S8 family serine peptidase, partial [Vibrio parahaemolyticus]|nr:S8 family serine peptidase [Vibrio parahaemolyticus]
MTCSTSDIMKAIDEAIHDGVDVLSISIVGQIPLNSETDLREEFATGLFHAVAKGIVVVCAGGN